MTPSSERMPTRPEVTTFPPTMTLPSSVTIFGGVFPQPETPEDVRGSVTAWLDGLKTGNSDATRLLWERYFRRMVDYSQGRLWGADRAASDGEDVALSAFDSFCRGIGNGRLEGHGRDRLWSLLVHIIGQKAADRVAHDRALKRGGAATRDRTRPLEDFIAPEPPPDLVAQLAEDFHALLELLPDLSLRAVAILKFEGYTNGEISRRLCYGLRTVERKLLVIRRIWSESPR